MNLHSVASEWMNWLRMNVLCVVSCGFLALWTRGRTVPIREDPSDQLRARGVIRAREVMGPRPGVPTYVCTRWGESRGCIHGKICVACV
jgi:hypothetical protein